MDCIEWKDIYSVKVREFDRQHKLLIDMINELYLSIKAGRGKEFVSYVLAEMIDYASTHFTLEEEYMKGFGFPEYEQHKIEHDKFTAKALDFQKRYIQGGSPLTFEVMGFLENWLVNHIQGTDKKYTLFLNMKGVS